MDKVTKNISIDFKKIFINFSQMAFGEFTSKIFGFFTSMYLARVLGVDNFGLYGFVSALSAYVILFSNFGIEQYSTRFLSVNHSSEHRQLIGTVLSTRVLLSFILCVPFVFFGTFYAYRTDERILFILQSIFIIAFSLNLQFYFVAVRRILFLVIVRIAVALLILICSFFLIHESYDLPLASMINGGVTLVIFLFVIVYIYNWEKIKFKLPSGMDILSLLKNAAPLGFSALMIQIYYSADIVFLGFTNPGVELGYYTGAYKIILIFISVPNLLYQIFLPSLATIQSEYFNSKTTHLYIGIQIGTGLFITILSYINASSIVEVVLGSSYAPAVGVFRILLLNVFLVFVNVSLGNLLIAWNRHEKYFFVVASGAGANIIANILLIPQYGIYGAAIATVIAEGTVLVVAVYYNQTLFGLLKRKKLNS